MGAIIKKPPEEEDPRTGLTHTECRLLRQTWHYYCLENRDYGVLIFTSFFVKSPESLSLFPRFCNRPVGQLTNDPQFRAHAFAVGTQLTSMVDNTQDPVLLEKLIRKNAMEHTERRGVMPDHFRILGKTVIEVLHAMNERRMNKAAVLAWEKLFVVRTARDGGAHALL
ncbi:hypothetical protein V5799_023360 [Amblyomma americanum]|uniref:Globin domain-containing protein n=2 Tax=Amblyomma americanum TaxID=6943 RepID=A0AAQ4FJC8_AMBAM